MPNRLVYNAPALTPEGLYKQDERRSKWDKENKCVLWIDGDYSTPGWYGDVRTYQGHTIID